MNLRNFLGLGCIAAALATMAGCGLPVDASPVPIPSSQIPQSLSEPGATQPIFNLKVGVPISTYLIAPGGIQLVEVVRYVPRGKPVTPQAVLAALEAGPTPTEADENVTTAVPPSADLISGGVDADGLLRVELDSSYGSLLPQQQALYFAQIVWTVTSSDLPYVRGVAFEYQNAFVEPEIGNGSQWTQYVVHRSEYEQMAPAKP